MVVGQNFRRNHYRKTIAPVPVLTYRISGRFQAAHAGVQFHPVSMRPRIERLVNPRQLAEARRPLALHPSCCAPGVFRRNRMFIRRLASALVLAGLVSLAGCKHCCGTQSNCAPGVLSASPCPQPGCSSCGGPGRPPGVVAPPPPPGPVGPPPGGSYYQPGVYGPSSAERKL
jgi:hypothetical protein